PPEPESPEEAPGPPLRRGRLPDAHHLLEECAGEVEFLRLLGEVPDVQAPAAVDGPRVRLLLANQNLQEGRLPRPVRPDEPDFVPLPELEVHTGEQEPPAMGLRDPLEPHDAVPGAARLEREAERPGLRGPLLRGLPLHLLDPELPGE